MLKISDFAQLSGTSVKTLQYYHDIGLFEAAQVDSITKYRYYAPEQLPMLQRIQFFKGLGFSLEEIRQFLREKPSTEQLYDLYEQRHEQIQWQIFVEQCRLLYVKAKLKQIQQEGQMSELEFTVKSVEAMKVIVFPCDLGFFGMMGFPFAAMFNEVRQYAQSYGVETLPLPISLTYEDEAAHTGTTIEFALPIKTDVPEDDLFKIVELPALSTVLSFLCSDIYLQTNPPQPAVMAWLEENQYDLGDSRQRVIILNLWEQEDSNQWLYEVQYPIVKRQTID